MKIRFQADADLNQAIDKIAKVEMYLSNVAVNKTTEFLKIHSN